MDILDVYCRIHVINENAVDTTAVPYDPGAASQ